jgi:hypothetical protein
MRKLMIAITAAVLVGLVFLGYLWITGSKAAPAPEISNVKDLPVQPGGLMPQQIGETIVKVAHQSRYTILNPQTKELSRVLGFQTLLNPGTDSSRWQVEKPYIEFYESSYLCRMDSDKGTFTVDSTGSNASPTDAQMEGNVVIHIQPRPGGKMSETFIYLDNLVFSSERSEFSTDGPVRIVSDQTLLEGYGMILIFNTGTGRLEYLNIRDLEQLVLKNVVEPQTTPSDEKTPKQDSETAAAVKTESVDKEAAASLNPAKSAGTNAASESRDIYQCILEDNVLIRYGGQLVVTGADNVSIQNILLKSASPSDSSVSASPAERRKKNEPQPDPAAGTVASAPAPTDASSQDNQPAASGKDVIVTCDGGIIFQPMQPSMQKPTAAKPPLNVQMTGAPLRIEQTGSTDDTSGKNQMLVHCGRLEYTPDEDILRLFTHSKQPQITLDVQPSNNRIETLGNVWWNRKTRQANVAGPGKIYLSNTSDPARESSEVDFGGAMDLLFAQWPEDSSSSAIETINLTGGMKAVLKENGWYQTSAQSAQLDFGPGNTLSEAFLNGGVKFESLKEKNPQRASSQAAALKFGPKNEISTAEMTGGVLFESRQENKASQAAAQQAVFYFDNSKIRTADLQGQVRFASEAGQFTSTDATIDFTSDADGAVQPGRVHTAGNAVLLAAVSSSNEPPAKFEAKKIDYDLQTRSGLAHGPVRFTFYQKAEAQSSSLEPWIPVVITADDKTQFLSDQTGAMERVIFNKNVLAVRQFKSFAYTQNDRFHGDKLTVSLAPAENGRRGISEITMAEGTVFAESVRMQNEQKVSHIKLTCLDIAWGRLANTIIAKGPGQMELDNSHVEQTAATDPKSFYQRPGFARVTGFETLRWDLAAQTLTVDGNADTLQMAYVPVTDGIPDKFLYANSVRFDMFFTKDSSGRIVLKRAFTDQGITFRELNKDQSQTLNEMVGQSLDYNPMGGNGWLKISGSTAVPCYLNGARVPSVFVNIETGAIETSLSTVPSVYSQ